MSIFSKENLGGMISSTGFKQQDCAAIVYMFRYLDEKMRCVTFEHVEDFTIDFEDEKRLFAQVKVNNIDMKFLKNMIEDYYRPGELNLFIGSGLDDKVRNLLMKKRKYEESKTLLSHQEAETDFTEECKKYGLVLEEINEIKVDAFDSFNCVSIAKNEINEWADKHCIFVDSQRILEELIAKISLDLRPYGGVMSKEDIIECICRHKKSKIVSLNDGSSFDESKKNIIKEIERLMKKMHREYDLLNVVKFEIEADCYLEALNSISGLYEAYHTEYKNVYVWLLNMNGQHAMCCEVIETDDVIEEIVALEYIKALYGMERYSEVIKVAKGFSENYDVMLYLGRSYMRIGQKHEAVTVFEMCVKEYPRKAEAYRELSEIYQFVSDKSMEYINQAIKIEPQNASSYLQKGKLKRFKERYEDAVRCYEKYMELSGDYQNEFVLRELAISLFYLGNQEFSIYCSRWIDRFINHQKMNELLQGEKIAICNIGCNVTTFMELEIENDMIKLSVNGADILKLRRQEYSTGCIGTYVSPYNYFLFSAELEMMRKIGEEVDIDDAESAIEDASVPALFKVFSDNETYNKTIEALLELDVLHINHKNEGCVEYIIDDKDIEVKLIKKKNSLDGIVNVGGYIVDIYIPNVGEGYQEFMRKYDSKSAYDEAVLLLVSPVEVTQITFMKNNICKIER